MRSISFSSQGRCRRHRGHSSARDASTAASSSSRTSRTCFYGARQFCIRDLNGYELHFIQSIGRVVHDEDLAHAIIDRILERGRMLTLDGPSLRTKHLGLDDPTSPEVP